MKYKINVCRIGYAFATIEVEAENQEQAEALAIEEAPNHDFSEKDADYQIA